VRPFQNNVMTTMRTTTILTAALLTLMTACSDQPEVDPQIDQLKQDNARSLSQVAERDSVINDLFGTFNRISENLRSIRSKQGQLLAPADGAEQGADMEQRIMGDLESIDGMLSENRQLLDKLRKQAKSSAASIAELERTVAELEVGMQEKDAEIGTLKEQLASTNSSLATLIEMYRDKSQLSDMQRTELNTAYYIVGTSRELRDSGVLSKEGGVVGIGGVNKLNTSALPVDKFTRIDVVRTQEITLGAKKAKLATAHPEGSYRLDGGNKLTILDANVFWSISKYLVVEVE
jgi:septal ring factor EnvC (AmiA/AmiB activator)